MVGQVKIALASSEASFVELNLVSSSIENIRFLDSIEAIVIGTNKIIFPITHDDKLLESKYIILDFFLSSENRDSHLILMSCRLFS